MDWRQLRERERFNQIKLLIREEISAVLEDIRDAVNLSDSEDDGYGPIASRIITAVQAEIEERGTDGSTA